VVVVRVVLDCLGNGNSSLGDWRKTSGRNINRLGDDDKIDLRIHTAIALVWDSGSAEGQGRRKKD